MATFIAQTLAGAMPQPAHRSGDWLFCVWIHDDNSLGGLPAGWTNLDSGTLGNGNVWAVYYKKAASSFEVFEDRDNALTKDQLGCAIVVSGADGTTPFDAATISVVDSGQEYNAPDIAPASAGALLLYLNLNDFRGYWCTPLLTVAEAARDFNGNSCVSVAYSYGDGAGVSVTGPQYVGARVGATWPQRFITIAIKDDGNNTQMPYIDRASPPATLLHAMFGNAGTGFLQGSNVLYDPTTEVPSITNDNTTFNASTIYSAFSNEGSIIKGASACSLETSSLNDSIEISGSDLLTTIDLSGAVLSFSWKGNTTRDPDTEIGLCLGLSDKTNSRLWQLDAINQYPNGADTIITAAVEVDGGYQIDDIGTFNSSAVTNLLVAGDITNGALSAISLGPLYSLATFTIKGGNVGADMATLSAMARTSALRTIQDQFGQIKTQFFCFQSVEISTDSFGGGSAQSISYAPPYSWADQQNIVQVTAGKFSYLFNPPSGATYDVSGWAFNMANNHKWGVKSGATGTVLVTGTAVSNATPVLNNSASALGGATLTSCAEAEYTTLADMSGGITFIGCTGTQQLTITGATQAALQAEVDKLNNCSLINSTGRALNIVFTGTGNVTLEFTGMTFTGNTTDVNYQSTNASALEIQDDGSGILAANCTISGAATGVTVTAPVNTMVINPSVDITGSIRAFDPLISEQTPEYSGTGDTLSIDYPDADPLDIEVVEQGYVPVNQQAVTPINGTLNIKMDLDEAYNASHALTIATHYTLDRGTKNFNILADQNAFDVRSSMADTIRTNSSYYNTPLLLEAKPGGKRIDLIDGATITSMATWKGAGMERYDAADAINPVEKWYAIQSVNDITGATVIYRQTNSGDFTVGSLTNNVFDEALQFYSDPDHDGTPATENNSYLLIKALQVGYRQARNDVVAGNGGASLKADLYTIGLAPTAHDYSGGPIDLSATMTLVAGGTVGGKTFAYKWVDAGTNSGTDIADWINYMGATSPNGVIPGGTGLRWAEMPDMVIYVTGGVETAQGYREGATPTLAGFYMERGGADHPDMVRAQADDGTYYTPATSVQVLAPNLIDGTLVVVADLDNPGTWLDNGTVVSGGGGYSLVLPFTANKNIQLRAGHADKRIVKENLLLTSGGATYLGTPAADEFYAHHAIDGSTVTGYALDYIFNEIDVVVPDVFNALQGYAWYKYKMMTDATALKRFAGLLDYLSLGHLRFDDVSVDPIVGTALDVKFDNITSPPKEIVESSGIRVDRASGTRPVRTPTTSDAGIDVDWRSDVYVALVTTSDQSLNLATAEQALANKGVTSARMAEMDSIPAILADTADMQPKVDQNNKLLRNKMVTDPATGRQILYDDDGITPLLQGDIWENAAGTIPYTGNGANRRDRLE